MTRPKVYNQLPFYSLPFSSLAFCTKKVVNWIAYHWCLGEEADTSSKEAMKVLGTSGIESFKVQDFQRNLPNSRSAIVRAVEARRDSKSILPFRLLSRCTVIPR
mmetsp:Transcript_16610/g.32409  ORF Transcript_16610/g.32409 Transcript_16610/m.32409 type:complete len:104 (-) Transcript_16610:168-479(-)